MWNCDHCEIEIVETSGNFLINIVHKMIQYFHFIRKFPPIEQSIFIYSDSDSYSNTDYYSDSGLTNPNPQIVKL